MNRLLGLELLRGVAALLVLVEHLPVAVIMVCGPDAAIPSAIDDFPGYWGVDLFFVLSGYLIGMTLSKPGTTARSFLLARLARILPLYYVVSAVCLLVPTFRSHALSLPVAVTTGSLLPLLGDALDPQTAHPYGWTLCFEMAFYLTATALAAGVGGRRAVPAMIGLFALGPLAFTALGPVAGWGFPNFALSPLAAEFAFGLLAYRLTDRLPAWAGWAVLGLGVAACVRGVIVGGDFGLPSDLIAGPRLAWSRVAAWGLPAAACVLGTARLDRAGTFHRFARIATPLGAMSYSLYLVQPFAFVVTAALAKGLGVTRPWAAAAVAVAVTLALGALVARYLDRPLHDLARGWAKRLATLEVRTRFGRAPGRMPLSPLRNSR